MQTEATLTREAAEGGPWYGGVHRKHWTVLTASFLGWVFDGYESYALVVAMPFILKAMLTPAQAAKPAIWAGVALGATLLGWGSGGIAGGILADYVGRKRTMVWSVLAYAVLSGLTALATGYWVLVALRFVTGLAMGSEWSTGVSLLAETWPNRARPKGAGFLQSGFGVGTLLAAAVWLALSTLRPLGPNTWRLMFAFGALPALFCLYIRRAIGESERWIEAVRAQRWAATDDEERRRVAAAPGAGHCRARPVKVVNRHCRCAARISSRVSILPNTSSTFSRVLHSGSVLTVSSDECRAMFTTGMPS